MSPILGYWTRDQCAYGPCEEPPIDDSDRCEDHQHCWSDPFGSWVPDVNHGAAS